MTNMPTFVGVYPILVTPFDEEEEVDLPSLERVIRFMIRIGVDGVTILGVLGESNRLTDSERESVIRTAVDASEGRIPVIVGCSHRGTRATEDLCRMAESNGASAVMVAPSREPVPGEERIFEYFLRVSKATSLPIVIQDHPASTDVRMSLPLLLRMIREIPAVACIKEEAPPTPERVSALARGTGNRPVPVLTGLGALYGIFDLERGSSGFMTGFAFPELLIGMVRAAREHRWTDARGIYEKILPLIVFEQQPGLAVRKELYRLRGLIESGRVRHPGAGLGPGVAGQLGALLDRTFPGMDLTEVVSVAD